MRTDVSSEASAISRLNRSKDRSWEHGRLTLHGTGGILKHKFIPANLTNSPAWYWRVPLPNYHLQWGRVGLYGLPKWHIDLWEVNTCPWYRKHTLLRHSFTLYHPNVWLMRCRWYWFQGSRHLSWLNMIHWVEDLPKLAQLIFTTRWSRMIQAPCFVHLSPQARVGACQICVDTKNKDL